MALPFYRAAGQEIELFETAADAGLPVMLVGPTGCGKTRFVEHMAARLGRDLRVLVGNDDTTTADLLGRHLLHDTGVAWHDGPVTAAARAGAVCYVDEVIEIRRDAIAALHPLADHRRALYLDRTGETVEAAPGFALVCSYNPARLLGFKELRPAFSQRFVTIPLTYLDPGPEAEVVATEGGVELAIAERLVGVATALREGLRPEDGEPPSTRTLIAAAQLIARGTDERLAVDACVVEPLVAGHADRATAARDIVAALLG